MQEPWVLFLVVKMEVVVHGRTLLPTQFSYELLTVSCKHRLYLILRHYPLRSHPLPSPNTYDVLPSGGIVVEVSPVRSLPADCPIFCIFKPSHLSLFHLYVVVAEALRSSQQFRCCPVRIF